MISLIISTITPSAGNINSGLVFLSSTTTNCSKLKRRILNGTLFFYKFVKNI